MNPSCLSELIPFLESIGTRPKKGLSQNFLVDPNIVNKIVCLADVHPGSKVLEIGSGPGALTAALLQAGAHVTAIEKDSLYARELDRLQNGQLEVIEGDFLELDVPGIDHVVGNLPYNITTPILEKVCKGQFSTFTFMAQKEFAARITAKPGSKACSSLTIFIQAHAEIVGAFDVSRNCFFPRPNVDSTVLKLKFRDSRDPEEFFALVRRAFQQRRKMITSSLKEMFSQELIRAALREAGASPEARPESLTLDQWRVLYRKLSLSNETKTTLSLHERQ